METIFSDKILVDAGDITDNVEIYTLFTRICKIYKFILYRSDSEGYPDEYGKFLGFSVVHTSNLEDYSDINTSYEGFAIFRPMKFEFIKDIPGSLFAYNSRIYTLLKYDSETGYYTVKEYHKKYTKKRIKIDDNACILRITFQYLEEYYEPYYEDGEEYDDEDEDYYIPPDKSFIEIDDDDIDYVETDDDADDDVGDEIDDEVDDDADDTKNIVIN